LIAIRLFCTAVALAAMLTASPVQAQESVLARSVSQADAVPSAPDDVSPAPNFSRSETAQNPVMQNAVPNGVQNNGVQNNVAQNQAPPQTSTSPDSKSSLPDAPTPSGSSTPGNAEYGKQNKRILGIVPNYRAVSANQHLPPLDFKGELWLATQDTFDYSDFIFVGALAGIDMASRSQPAFGQGAEGFGKYYWHVFVDGAIENYMTEAIIPAPTKEDPRYYTLGKGGFAKRTGYAVSRLFITRTNSGGRTFNLSEIVGAGAAAGIGNAYYPAESNPWVKTYQRWGTQVGLDGIFNVIKEFWPDVNQKVFHGKY
jgi:hypothetical protein